MSDKYYDSIATYAACKMSECRGCIMNYLMELCPYMSGSPDIVRLGMNLGTEEPDG